MSLVDAMRQILRKGVGTGAAPEREASRELIEGSRAAMPIAAAPERDATGSEGVISRDHVLWAYRLFLDREAGPQDDVAAKLDAFRSTRDLRVVFLSSPEYSLSNPGGASFVPRRGTVITELPGNLRLFLDLSDRVIGMNILQGNYELEEVEFIRSCIVPGDHVLDVGANIGYFSVLMASWVGEAGSVVAFEPVPANLLLLRRSIAENRFENRVQVIPGVVADEVGEADLLTVDVRYAFNSGGAYIVGGAAPTPRDHRRIRVMKTQLDALDMPRPVSFIKIDVEGAKALALRGAKELLRTDRPRVLTEINPEQLLKVSGTSATDWIAEMAGLGFECRVLERGSPGELIRTTASLINVVFLPLRP